MGKRAGDILNAVICCRRQQNKGDQLPSWQSGAAPEGR